MAAGDEEIVEVGVDLNINAADAARDLEQGFKRIDFEKMFVPISKGADKHIGKAIELAGSFGRTLAVVERAARDSAEGVGKIGDEAKKAADQTQHVWDSATQSMKQLGGTTDRVKQAIDALADAGRKSGQDQAKGFNAASASADEFADDIAILQKRIEATRKTLQKAGADPDLFASLDLQLQKLLRFQAEFNKDFERFAQDDVAAKAMRTKLNAISKAINAELGEQNRAVIAAGKLQTSAFAQTTAGIQADGRIRQAALKKETAVITAEAQIQNTATRTAARERTALINKERAEFVVNAQREGAQLLAETRATNARRLQSERNFQRTRLELLRFTLNQIRTLERAVGRVFSGAASLIAGAAGRISDSVQRIGKVFRNGNRELNDGLQPALLSRERSIQRSFERQNSIVQSSIIRQSRTIERFQAQASTGLAGAVTGRSTAGALLGGGLAFGGGFLLLDKLRAGFNEAVNLNEALNKTRQIFGDASADIEAFAGTSVENLFVTGSAALEAAANFGIFGKAAGLQGQPLADFSKRLTVLATDLASFNNTQVDEAVTALAAAMRGESEPIRRFGILLNEQVLQTRALEEGIIDEIRVLKPAERVLAAYNEILAQTTVQQGDAARTANDFANSSRRAAAASVETFASIAGALVPLATFLTNFTFVVLPKLTNFIEGNVGPGLEILRDGLIGAGAALGSLVAAKGAIEVLKFLVIALRAVLTPMGLFVTAVAGIGAAIKIFQDRSPEFASAIRTISGAVRDVLGDAVDLVGRGLERLGDIIDDVILPALGDLARIAGRGLRAALEFGIGFIVTVVVPGFQAFARLLTDVVLPALVDFGSEIVDRIGPALRFLRDTAGAALDAILPFLEPAIDGFRELGEVIIGAATAAATGDFSGIGDSLREFVENISVAQVASAAGLGVLGTAIGGPIGGAIGVALGVGLGGSLSKISQVAIDALLPQFAKLLTFIEDFFSKDRLKTAGIAVLAFVNEVGRILGDIATDPKVLIALEAIAAAVAAFFAGVVEGIAKNIPDLIDLLTKQFRFVFRKALEEALDNPALFVKIIAGIFAGSLLITAVRRNAAGVGGAAGAGFVTGFARTVRSGFRSNEFASGFFGGAGRLERAAASEGLKAGQAMVRERDRALRNLERLGGNVDLARVFSVGSGGQVDVLKTGNAQAELDKLIQKFGATAASGALLRTQLGEAATGIGQTFKGVFTAIVTDSERGIAAAEGGFRRFRTGISDAFANVRTSLRQTGVGVGQALGGAILSGVGAALAGQQLGQATSAGGQALGLAGIISSALFAGAAVGGGAQGVVIGAAVAGLGLITAAFTDNGEAAEQAKAEIDGYVDILKQFNNVADATPALAEQITDVLLNQDAEIRRVLRESGFDVTAFVNQVSTGQGSLSGAIRGLTDGLDIDERRISAFIAAEERLGSSTGEALDELDKAARGKTATNQAIALAEEFRNAGVDAEALVAILKILNEQAGFILTAQGNDELREQLLGAADATKEAADGTVVWRDGIAAAGREIQERFSSAVPRINAAGDAVIELTSLTLAAAKQTDEVGDALEHLERQRLEGLNARIDAVRDSLGAARDAVTATLDELRILSQGSFADPFQEAIDNAVTSIPGIAEALSTALAGVNADNNILTRTALSNVERGFQNDISTIFQQAVEKFGADITGAELESAFAPLREAISVVTVPVEIAAEDDTVTLSERPLTQEEQNKLLAQIDELVFNPTVEGTLEKLNLQQTAVDQLEADLVALQAELPVEIIFSTEQVSDALRELFPNLLVDFDPNEAFARQMGLDPETFNLNALNFGQGGVIGAELANDPALRAFIASEAARAGLTPSAPAPTTVVQGDLVGQKVESQSFQSSDPDAQVAAQARAMRAAARSSLGPLLRVGPS